MSTDLFERYGRLDPVPTGDVVDDAAWSSAVLLDVIDERNGTMQTDTRVSSETKRPRNRWGLAVAAAAFAGVLLLGALAAIQWSGDDTVEPANTTTTTEAFDRATAETEALAVAEAYEAAFLAGDVEALLAMQAIEEDADRHVYEFNAAVHAAGYGFERGGCEVAVAAATLVRVECTEIHTDPLFTALGMETVTNPLSVYPDGTVRWQPISPDPAVLGKAIVEYLEASQPAEYEAVCSPAAYPPGSVVDNNRLALTGACGELVATHLEAIGAWIEDGNFSG